VCGVRGGSVRQQAVVGCGVGGAVARVCVVKRGSVRKGKVRVYNVMLSLKA